MKSQLLNTITMLAALANAQGLSDIPSCYLPCLDGAIAKKTKCALNDITCICRMDNLFKIQSDSKACGLEKCGSDTFYGAISDFLTLKALIDVWTTGKVIPALQSLCGGN